MSGTTKLHAAQLAVARAKRSHGTPEKVRTAEHNLRKVRALTHLEKAAADFATLSTDEKNELLEILCEGVRPDE